MGRSVEYRATTAHGARYKSKALKNSGCPRAIAGFAKGFYRAMHSYGMRIETLMDIIKSAFFCLSNLNVRLN
jgi:hypothetical protein